MLTLYCFLLFFSLSSGMMLNYTNVTQPSVSEASEVVISVPGLEHLFVMTTNFINVVFKPFSTIEEFIFTLLAQSDNSFNSVFFNELLSQWQTLANFEVGFMVCFIIGCLFIIFVPIIGLIMCCCRTCCNNCGGEMEQTLKRAKSGWRHCFTISLFICSIFMAIPCIFVYLTNVWASDALREIPQVTVGALNNLNNYISILPEQLNEITGEYGRLENSIREDFDNIGNRLGSRIQNGLLNLTEPVLFRLMELSDITETTLTALENVQTSTNRLDNGIGDLNRNLSELQNDMNRELDNSVCRGNPNCNAVLLSTGSLNSSGADFSAVDDIGREISNLNDTLNRFNLSQQAESLLALVNEVPERVMNNSRSITESVYLSLDSFNETLVTAVQELPLGEINSFNSTLSNAADDISTTLTLYNDNYDVYRYVAGAVLASVLAVIVILYWFGILSGTASFSAYPSSRSALSNCGGISIMAAVGLSFIFSWLFMILVVLFFTIGGHGERYLCQNLESPYEGLRVADELLARSSAGSGFLFNISVRNIAIGCERNESIYRASGLAQVFNISGIAENVSQIIDDVEDELNSLDLDISNMDMFPPDLEESLNSIRDSGFGGINFTSYIEQINKGLTSANLIIYAQFLSDSARNISDFANMQSPANQDLLDQAQAIQNFSIRVLSIQSNNVDGLSMELDQLNATVIRLDETADGFNESVDGLSQALQTLNTTMGTTGGEIVNEALRSFTGDNLENIVNYVGYVVLQVEYNFGACRPLFLVYTQLTAVLCSYLIEILNGFWFSLGWCVAFLLPSAILGMKLAKFFRKMPDGGGKDDEVLNDMELEAMNRSNNNNSRLSSAKLRSSKVHPASPGQYY